MGNKSSKTSLFELSNKKPVHGNVNPTDKNFLKNPNHIFNEKNIYVITSVFNPAGFMARPRLYNEFKQRLMNIPDVILITVECAFDDNPFQVTKPYNEPFDIQVRANSKLWLKENLINIGISKLPKICQNIMWVDSDIEFCDPNWTHKVRYTLKNHPVAQIFKSAEYLGPDMEILRIDKSFSFYFNTQQEIGRKQSMAHYRHPGYGWCATREFLTATGGLFDKAILGNGDKHMAYSFIGQFEDSIPPTFTLSPGFMDQLKLYQERSIKAGSKKMGFINMSIRHHYHGDRQDRQYMHRWFLLQHYMYDPRSDLKIGTYGQYELAGKPDFGYAIVEYFQNRNEDSKVTRESLADYVEMNKKMAKKIKQIEKEEKKKAKELLGIEKVKYKEEKVEMKRKKKEDKERKLLLLAQGLKIANINKPKHKKSLSFDSGGSVGNDDKDIILADPEIMDMY